MGSAPARSQPRVIAAGMMEEMAVLHITEAELARNAHALLEKVRQGTEIVIEENARPIAVIKPAAPAGRKLSEIAAALSPDSTAILDEDFEPDVQDFIDRHREPLDTSNWD